MGEFQRLGEDRLKALDPMVVRLADGAKSWMVEEDWRVWEGVCGYGYYYYDCVHLSTVLQYTFEVLVLCLNISIFCYFTLPVHYILKANIVLFTLHLLFTFFFYFIYLITLVASYFADCILHQSQRWAILN